MLEKKYNPEEVEKTRYDWWLDHGYFKAGDKEVNHRFVSSFHLLM